MVDAIESSATLQSGSSKHKNNHNNKVANDEMIQDSMYSEQEKTYYTMLLAEDLKLFTSSLETNTKTDAVAVGVVKDTDESISHCIVDLDEALADSNKLNNSLSNSSESDDVVVTDDDNDDVDDNRSDVSDLSDDKSVGLTNPFDPSDLFSFSELVSATHHKRTATATSANTSQQQLKSLISKKSSDLASSTVRNPASNTLTTSATSADDNKIFEFDFRVSFKDVTIRKYSYILGDNPACSGGPSLSISWDHHSEEKYTVDEYEYSRDDIFTKDLVDMAMSGRTRLTIVRNLGHSDDEIKAAIEEIQAVKAQRMATAKRNLVEKTGKVFSTVKLKFNKIIGNKKNDKSKRQTQFSVCTKAA